MRRLEPSLEHLLDKCAERNARLVVRLQQAGKALHQALQHAPTVPWQQCEDRGCQRTRDVLAGNEQAQAR